MSDQFWNDMVEDIKAGRKTIDDLTGKTRAGVEQLLMQEASGK